MRQQYDFMHHGERYRYCRIDYRSAHGHLTRTCYLADVAHREYAGVGAMLCKMKSKQGWFLTSVGSHTDAQVPPVPLGLRLRAALTTYFILCT